jgi:hypothetical protein
MLSDKEIERFQLRSQGENALVSQSRSQPDLVLERDRLRLIQRGREARSKQKRQSQMDST